MFTPFVYVMKKMTEQLGVGPLEASYFLSVLGAFSTVSRVLTGFLADRPSIDALILHNGAAIIAGVATLFVFLLDSYALLLVYGAVFGVFSGTFAHRIGVGDGGAESGGHVPPKIRRKIFFGNNYVKFGHFSGKNHVKFGKFVNFGGGDIIKIRVFC